MRILQLTQSISRLGGGLFNSVRKLGDGLLKEGIECKVIAAIDRYSEADRIEWDAKVDLYKPTFNNSGGFSFEIFNAVRREEYDVGFAHGLWGHPSIILGMLPKAVQNRWIIHPHGMADSWALRQSKFKKVLALNTYQKIAFNGASCIRALNIEEARSVRSIVACKPIFVVPNSVEILSSNPDLHRLENSLNGDRRSILFLGRLHEKKGITELIKGWALAGIAKKGFILNIAGWGDPLYIKALSDMITSMGLTQSVSLLGPSFGENKENLFREACGFILPSYSEGLPIAVLEAWTRSVPTIISPQCNLSNAFEAGAALSVLPTPESISSSLNIFSRLNYSEMEALVINAHNLCTASYSEKVVAKQMHSVSEWVLGGGVRPDCFVDF